MREETKRILSKVRAPIIEELVTKFFTGRTKRGHRTTVRALKWFSARRSKNPEFSYSTSPRS
jgi:hypothetical protein